MSNSAIKIKESLLSIIMSMKGSISSFVKNPGKDFSRNRKITFEEIIQLLLTMEGRNIRNEIMDYFKCKESTLSTSAFSQQRDKILPYTFEYILDEFTHTLKNADTFQGYRLLAVDGSDLNIAYNPDDSTTYFHLDDQKGYNLLHLNAMYDLCNNVYVDAIIQPRKSFHEHRALVNMTDRSNIPGKVLVIADRGYEGYNVFAHMDQKGWNYLIRVRDRNRQGIVTALDLPDSNEFDLWTKVILTNERTNEFKANKKLYRFVAKEQVFDFLDKQENRYYSISMRVVRFHLKDDTYETVITNLPEDEFPPAKLKELYGMRWGIETSFRLLKHTIGLKHFHSKKAEFITQEIFARLIMFNFSGMIIHNTIISKKNTKHTYKVNFSAAVLICRFFLRFHGNESPPDIEALLLKNLIPVRPGRQAPRRQGIKHAFSFKYRLA